MVLSLALAATSHTARVPDTVIAFIIGVVAGVIVTKRIER